MSRRPDATGGRASSVPDNAPAAPTEVPWGEVGGERVTLFDLTNDLGMRARILDLGGTLVGLELPTDDAGTVDVVLGYDAVDGERGHAYLSSGGYFGALVGRVANRIAGAAFELDGEHVEVAANDGRNSLHGGSIGFDRRRWRAQSLALPDGPALALSYVSPDLEEGYPGTVHVLALYQLTHRGTLRLELRATTDRPTPVSLTNHSYWNLAGHGAGDVLDHELTLFADVYTPAGPDSVPVGTVLGVDGTPFDFREAKRVGRDLGDPAVTAIRGGGYDTNVVVRGRPGTLRPAARLRDPASGRVLEVWTTQPGLQVYSGNFLDGSHVGKGGAVYDKHAGMALEPQAYPNAVNTPHFPSAVLRPGQIYRQLIEYRFG